MNKKFKIIIKYKPKFRIAIPTAGKVHTSKKGRGSYNRSKEKSILKDIM